MPKVNGEAINLATEEIKTLAVIADPAVVETAPKIVYADRPSPNLNTFRHSGDLGDIIYAMPAMRDIGGGCLYLVSLPVTKTMDLERFNAIAPLLKSQEYISDVRWWDGEIITHDFTDFRRTLKPKVTLAEIHSRYIGTDPKGYERQWIHLEPINHSRILIHRSPRCHNDLFPWVGILEHFGKQLLYCGLSHEHDAFTRAFGNVEFYEPKDFLEYGRMIEGSSLFIGNQSSPYAIAEGLKHETIQEAYLHAPDCVYIREGATLVTGDTVFWKGSIIHNPPRWFFADNGTRPIKVNLNHFVKWERRLSLGGGSSGIYTTCNSGEIAALRSESNRGIREISKDEYDAFYSGPK